MPNSSSYKSTQQTDTPDLNIFVSMKPQIPLLTTQLQLLDKEREVQFLVGKSAYE